MTTDLPSNVRAPKTSDAFVMAMLGVSQITGVAEVNGKSLLVVPGLRPVKYSDQFQQHAEGIKEIAGAIENGKTVKLVTPQQRACML